MTDFSRIYTLAELHLHTADVLREINESGEPAVITRHGRFLAVITPVAGINLEGKLIGEFLKESPHLDDEILEGVTTEELRAELGL